MLGKLVCTPGNGGISKDCQVADVKAEDIDGIVDLAKSGMFDLVICGPEIPLSMGLADRLRSEGIPVYGPSKTGLCWRPARRTQKIL